MSDINNFIKQRVSGPIAKDTTIKYYEGIVTNADRENNCCTVIVANLNGQEYENVPIALHDEGTNWFPKATTIDPDTPVSKIQRDIDSLVTVEVSNSGVAIVGPWRGIPYAQFRASQELNNDVHPDSGGSVPGGMID